MASSTDTDLLTIVGRVIVGLWAINFLLLITETVTYPGQSGVSFALAIASVGLLLLRQKST